MPGRDKDHLGGDIWVTDAAFRVMNREDWSGMLLTYGGIDKAGHIRYRHPGPLTPDLVNTEIRPLLAELAK